MTTEAIVTKLAYLCCRFPNMLDVERWMGVSIRGELTGALSTSKKPYFDSSPGTGTGTPTEVAPLRDTGPWGLLRGSSTKRLP